MKRVQRKRDEGWRKPENTRWVGRGSLYGNPFEVKDFGRAKAIEEFILCLHDSSEIPKHEAYFKNLKKPKTVLEMEHYFQRLSDSIPKLKEFDNLMCYCSLDVPCHADILIELLNIEL